ncbi:hypothetical protein [uncultured Helicobacter sp.]|uniref:hypothetical protein n=1 Tax=uncultured Helicobacter sp. TaxID=175537 RepID=UPI0026231805|nr:hypothetical protein [uncultured Helicobacter sp.]
MKSIFKLLLATFCITSMNADNFVQATKPPVEPKVVVKVPPLTPFDETLQQEMKKYPQDSMFFVDGKTGKILSVNKTPSVKSSGPNPGKFYPRDEVVPNNPNQTAPYKIQEERIDLL